MYMDNKAYKIDNIVDLISGNLTKDNQSIAWIKRIQKQHQETFSYADIAVAADNLQHNLIDFGIKKGDVVGLLSSNGPEWAVGAIALWRLGAVVAPIHHANSVEDIDAQVELLQAKLILTYKAPLTFANEIDIDLEALLASDKNSMDLPKVTIQGKDEALRIYTSGSTGNSKMVRLSHLNLSANVQQIMEKIKVSSADRFLSLLPLSHVFELTTGFLLPLTVGASVVVPRVLAAKEIFAAMKENEVTAIVAVPRFFRTIYQNIMKQAEEGSVVTKSYIKLLGFLPLVMRKKCNVAIRNKIGSKLRICVSGGAALDPSITRGFHKLGLSLIQGYGLTETAPVIAAQEEFDVDCVSVGKPLPYVEVKIQAFGADAHCGEVWVKGPNIMLGYTDEAANAEVFEDGWFKTGDLGYLDSKQRLVLTGRKKRLIVTEAGKNVYPEDIEVKIERFDRVIEAAIVEWDLKPVAVVAVAETVDDNKEKGTSIKKDIDGHLDFGNAQQSLAERRAYVKSILTTYNKSASKHNQVSRFAVVDELPHTPLGKIAFKELVQVFADNEV